MEHFGPYRIEAELGRGRSGTVFRARDTGHGDRVVALKVLHAHLSADPAFRARFHRDAAVLGAVREPHVAPVHSVGEIAGRLYVDMRLVRGPSLADVLRHGPLDPARAHEVAAQLGSARESLLRGGLGPRAIAREDVLLTGAPGRGEFVQIVGLGLGGPPVDPRAVEPPDSLVRPADGRRAPWKPTRWVVGVAALALVAVLAVVLVVTTNDAGPAAPLATLPDVGGLASDVRFAELDGRPVIVTANGDRSVGVWDPRSGEPVRPAFPADAQSVAPVVLDGRPVVAVLRADATIALFDLDTGRAVGRPFGTPVPDTGMSAADRSGRIGAGVTDGSPVLVAARIVTPENVGLTQVYRLPDPEPVADAVTWPEGFTSFPILPPIDVDGRAVVAEYLQGATVQARDVLSGQLVGTASDRIPSVVNMVTAAVGGEGEPLAVVGTEDGTVRVLDLGTGEQVHELTGLPGRISGIHTVRAGDRTVVVGTTRGDGSTTTAETRFWDLDTGAPLDEPLVAHPLADGPIGAGAGFLLGRDQERRVTVWEASRVIDTG